MRHTDDCMRCGGLGCVECTSDRKLLRRYAAQEARDAAGDYQRDIDLTDDREHDEQQVERASAYSEEAGW